MTPEQATATYILICAIWFCFRLRTIFNRNGEITLNDIIVYLILIFTPLINIIFIVYLLDDEKVFEDVVLFKRKEEESED